MIRAVRANMASFREVRFAPGFNVVLADRAKESTRRDTRNGLGKSTLVEVVHFCLGSQPRKNKGLLSPNLRGWEFTVDLELDGRHLSVTRAVDAPGVVRVVGDTSGWPVQPDRGEVELFARDAEMPLSDWVALLGAVMFGLSVPGERGNGQGVARPGAGRAGAAAPDGPAPSFRSLISYVMRRGREGFITPFEHHRKQAEWDRQLHTAFLLGLAWEDARDWARLRERKKFLRDTQRAAKAGVTRQPAHSIGELEAAKVRLERKVREDGEALASFKVHSQYRDVEVEANELTRALHVAANDDVADQRVLAAYEQSVREEQPAAASDVGRLYGEAGITLPDAVVRRLNEVEVFHAQVVANRRTFLQSEISRLERAIRQRDAEVRRMSDRRAELMQLLATHGALDEYTQLERRYLESVQRLREIEALIAELRELQRGQSELRVQQETLRQRAQLDYDARRDVRDRAIALFTTYSEALYGAPGNLIIDVAPDGFRFDVEIERAGSNGVENMKIFCYDLTLATLWARRRPTPGLWVHDSAIFDGVDERQVALALELAAVTSAAEGFQYICTLNSDTIPETEFSEGFTLAPFVRHRLTDETEEGSLLGIRFEASPQRGRRRAPAVPQDGADGGKESTPAVGGRWSHRAGDGR